MPEITDPYYPAVGAMSPNGTPFIVESNSEFPAGEEMRIELHPENKKAGMTWQTHM
jgi:hypothetical protein